MSKIELHKSSRGNLIRPYIVVFNAKNCISSLSGKLNDYYYNHVKRYDLITGIPYKICQDKDCASATNLLVTQIASAIQLTPREMGYLRDATEVVFRGNPKLWDLTKLYRILKESESAVSDVVAEKIHSICGEGYFREGEFFSEGCNKIYEIDLNSVALPQQNVLQEFLLSIIHSWGLEGKFVDTNLIVFIDEMQDLSLKPGSPLNILLNQGRKLGINLVMARPDTSFSKRETAAIYQCAYKAYFRPPSNSRRIAREINPRSIEKITMQLNSLKIGEFLLDGDIAINGTEVGRRQVVVSSYATEGDTESSKAV